MVKSNFNMAMYHTSDFTVSDDILFKKYVIWISWLEWRLGDSLGLAI